MDVKITDLSTLQPKDITILNDPDASTITLSDPTTTVTVATDQLAITTSAESTNLGDLQDVTITSVANGQLIAYNSSTGKWENTASSTGVTSVNTKTGAVTLDTDDISEGSSNLYYTDARVQTKIDANSAGFITASSTNTLTNKSGNISMFTNDAGYLTSETDSQTLSFSSPNLSISGGNSVDISAITSAYLPLTGGALTGALTTNSTIDGVDIATRDGVLTSTTTTANAALPKAGGTMTGAIAMGTSKITGMGDPTANQDAATKAYVDATVSSGAVTASSTTTFTNKTIDANGTGNSITNLEVADLASGVLDTDISSVSGSDDTLASAKAIKTYADTKLSDVVSDTSPQLGGDLDVNGQSIVSTSNGNIVIDPNGTGKLYVEGDGTAPTTYGERLARLANPPMVIDNNQTNAWWGSQMIFKDNSDDIFAMVGREDTSNKVYGYIITMDPNGTNTNSSSYAGDYGFYFNMQYEGGSGNDEWYMIHNVFGADDGYFINSFGSGHNSYARTPLILNGSLTVGTTDVDLKGLKLKDSTGSVTVQDNMTVNLDSSGTTALVTENESATANGNRITVGKSDTAHTSGVGFEVRRGTGSGFETQFKVETASSRTRTTVTSAFNLIPVAYANLHGAPSVGDMQFLTTDGAGASKNKPIYYDGSDWKYVNNDSTVASS